VKPDQPLKRWAIVWSPSGAFAGGGARATQAKKINKVRRGPHRRSARARWVATPGRKQASPAAIRNDKGFIGTDGARLIGIGGRVTPPSPATPPYMRVRIPRFGGLS
jgi:hypothetical protein